VYPQSMQELPRLPPEMGSFGLGAIVHGQLGKDVSTSRFVQPDRDQYVQNCGLSGSFCPAKGPDSCTNIRSTPDHRTERLVSTGSIPDYRTECMIGTPRIEKMASTSSACGNYANGCSRVPSSPRRVVQAPTTVVSAHYVGQPMPAPGVSTPDVPKLPVSTSIRTSRQASQLSSRLSSRQVTPVHPTRVIVASEVVSIACSPSRSRGCSPVREKTSVVDERSVPSRTVASPDKNGSNIHASIATPRLVQRTNDPTRDAGSKKEFSEQAPVAREEDGQLVVRGTREQAEYAVRAKPFFSYVQDLQTKGAYKSSRLPRQSVMPPKELDPEDVKDIWD